jgi:4-amino-4-deoxy-L-arabinose transferase-like glycosyltransferase
MSRLNNKYPLFITVIAAVAFIPFLGNVHLFDWDEINFAESAREMIITGDYFRVRVGFQPFWEKPPLFFWLQSASMHLFGINEFAARLPNALMGILTLLTLYYIGKKERNERFGLLWSGLYFASLAPHLYFKSGIIDPVFNFFIFTGIYFIYRTLNSQVKRSHYSIYAGFLIGLAVLTKGPVGLLIPILAFLVFLVINRFKRIPSLKDFSLLALMVFLVSTAWYGLEIIKNGPWFLVEFVKYQVELFSRPVADHQQPLYYHFLVVLIGCFPMSVLALPGFRKKFTTDMMAQWMMILFWVVMILFTIVTTKIIHYSSLAYLPLSFIAAAVVNDMTEFNEKLPNWTKAMYLFIGGILGAALTILPLISVFRDELVPYINDPFAVAGIMKPVPWSGYEYIFGLVFILAVIVSFIFILKRQFIKAIVSMAVGTAYVLMMYLVFILPKIEAHTQGSLIQFFNDQKGKDVYVMTYGFYSYAKFFYFEQPNDFIEQRGDDEYLLYGKIDKPVIIVSKITDNRLLKRQDIQVIGEEGGFRFYIREIPD